VNRKTSNPTVSQIFGKQLMCIGGVSTKKVSGILQVYPTMSALAEAYEDLDNDDDSKARKQLLAKVPLGGGERMLGPKVSESIAKVFTKE
jgi:hypothetical protein